MPFSKANEHNPMKLACMRSLPHLVSTVKGRSFDWSLGNIKNTKKKVKKKINKQKNFF